MEVKIKIRAFTHYEDVPNPSNPDETIAVSRLANQGETVEVSDADYERGLRFGAFFTEDEGSADAASEFSVVDASDDELDDYLLAEEPNVDATIALANGDSESAQRILDAENRVTDGSPRKGVTEVLKPLAEGGV